MPGPLRKYRRDPNKKNRGKGLYYHRGKGYYSKYSKKRDARKHSGGDTTVGRGKYRHTHDWSNPGIVDSPYGRMPESAYDMIARQEAESKEATYRLFKHSDFYDPHFEDSSLTARERKRELKEKLRTGLF